jgi:hypothetical protein
MIEKLNLLLIVISFTWIGWSVESKVDNRVGNKSNRKMHFDTSINSFFTEVCLTFIIFAFD